MSQAPWISHTSTCDLETCVNYGIVFDVWSAPDGTYAAFCAGCDRNITHTCVPKE